MEMLDGCNSRRVERRGTGAHLILEIKSTKGTGQEPAWFAQETNKTNKWQCSYPDFRGRGPHALAIHTPGKSCNLRQGDIKDEPKNVRIESVVWGSLNTNCQAWQVREMSPSNQWTSICRGDYIDQWQIGSGHQPGPIQRSRVYTKQCKSFNDL